MIAPRTERGTVQLTDEEKAALKVVAFIRNETEGNILRLLTPPAVLTEYKRVNQGLSEDGNSDIVLFDRDA